MTYDQRLLVLKSNLAKNIKELRLNKGLAQEKLALEANVDRTLVSKIERQIANPSLEILLKIAISLEVPISELIKE
jgi:transcriptional regulator with XRE-family HTH domain